MSPEEAKALVFEHWEYLRRIAQKRFMQDSQLAEEAIDYMLDKLSANEWQKVREYAGKGFTAFITVVANRLFTDFARRIGVVPYVPQWIEANGTIWRKAYWLLLKGTPRQEVMALLASETAEAEHIVMSICQRERLQASRPNHVSLEDENLAEPVASDLPPLEQLSSLEDESLLNVIFSLLKNLSTTETQTLPTKDKVQEWQQRIATQITLEDEEYLFLVMVYRDGLTVSEAGRRLQLNVNQAQGRHRRLLTRLHSAFQRCGIAEELRLLLE